MKAVLDTNFVMIPEKFGVDVYEELKFLGYDELVILSPVKREVRLKAGRVSRQLFERQELSFVEAEGSADDAIVEYAKKHDVAVCTQDKTLKNRLKALKIPVLSLRGGKVLRSV